ncbi:MAG: hypothetical protein QG639_1102 [Patescibacteria group bacterium]|nr:hypothetical protein [Patescibacteria group bacterium]
MRVNNILLYGFLFFLAFGLRIYPLTVSHPFWVDEFSTAVQAKIYATTFPDTFSQTKYDIEPNNYLYHTIVAIFFRIFMEAEWAARLPAAMAGALVCVVVYIYAKKLFNTPTAGIAFALTTFSYFHLTWSTQARGYTLQQLLLLVSHVLIFHLQQSRNNKERLVTSVGIGLCIVLGLLTHTTFVIGAFSIIIYLAFSYKDLLLKKKKLIVPLLGIFLLGLLLWLPQIVKVWQAGFLSLNNNLWYYHALLWREETIIVFLAVVALLKLALNRKPMVYLPLLTLGAYLILFTFIFQPYTSRYVMSYFPFLLLLAAYGIYSIGLHLSKHAVIPAWALTVFILVNGHTFEVFPQRYFSVNHTMRDIALVDYDQIYQRVTNSIETSNEPVVMIDTWRDRAWWYLGIDYPHLYIFRWDTSTQTINGLLASSDYYEENGRKYMKGTGNPPIQLIVTKEDLLTIIAEHPKGYIWIDDTSLPADVIEYVEQNMKKELFVDHYTYDDNAYSLWPGTLYSWGM